MSRVLVTFGSKHGATAEIADVVAETLRACGLDVDCVDAGDVERLDGYDAVILGSAVYMRRWRREAPPEPRRRSLPSRAGPVSPRSPLRSCDWRAETRPEAGSIRG